MNYYVYVYLKEDGAPYYVGKGKDSRWKHKSHSVQVPPPERVIFPLKDVDEKTALLEEINLIEKWGRLNNGTGILDNKTDIYCTKINGKLRTEVMILNLKNNIWHFDSLIDDLFSKRIDYSDLINLKFLNDKKIKIGSREFCWMNTWYQMEEENMDSLVFKDPYIDKRK